MSGLPGEMIDRLRILTSGSRVSATKLNNIQKFTKWKREKQKLMVPT